MTSSKLLKDFTLEENDNILEELDEHKHAKLKIRKTITFLEYRLMKALRTIETMKDKMEALKGEIKVGGSATSDKDMKAKVEAPKPPMFKGAHDTQVVENICWHLENYFKCNKVKSNKNKINTAVLHLLEMVML